MAGLRKFGVVVAERRLTTRGVRPRAVTITLGKPRLPKGSRDWECPFRISGAGLRILEYGYGVDSMQAVATALQGIRHHLDESGKSFDWFGMRVDDGGFQRFIPWWGDLQFTKRLERLIDSEVERYPAHLRRRRLRRKQARKAAEGTLT